MSSEDLPVQDTETSISPGNDKLGSIAERHAKRLLDRVQRGEPLAEAAKAERMTVAQLKDQTNPIRVSLEQLVGRYFLPPEARKQMVRAGLNKMFLENVESGDPANAKIALEAAKQIGSDPEVGLQAEQSGGVIINIADLEGVFKQLAATKVPELIDGRGSTENGRPREDRIAEAEFSDLQGSGDKSVSIPNVSE